MNHSVRVKTTPVILISGDFVPYGGMDAGNWALARHLATDPNLELHLVAHRIHDDLTSQPSVRFHQVQKPLRSNFLGFPCIANEGRQVSRSLQSRGVRTLVNGGNCSIHDASWVHYLHAAHQPITGNRTASRISAWIHHQVYLRCEQRWLPRNQLVFANSARTKADILKHYPIEPQRIQVLYYGSDPTRFYPASKQERADIRTQLGLDPKAAIAIFIGALGDRRKGFDLVYRAWQTLRSRGAFNLNLIVIGAGQEADHWKTLSAADGLESHIRFLGFRTDVERWLRASDLMIHPARYEAYGLAVQEALCCGIPAIVSAHAGVVERFSEALRPLQLNTPESASELTDKIALWIKHQSEFAEEASKVGDVLRETSWSRMAQQMTHLWLSPKTSAEGTAP